MTGGQRSRRPPARRRRRIGPAQAGLIALVIALLCAASALALVGEEGGRAPGDVTVDGIEVGGMTASQIEAVVRRRAAVRLSEPLVIETGEAGGYRLEASRGALRSRPQVERTVAEALEPRSPMDRLLGRLGLGGDRELTLGFTLDEDRVDALVDQVTGELNSPARSASVELRGGEPVVVPAQTGSGVDPEELRSKILAFPSRIVLERDVLQPAIGDEAAEQARARAAAVLAQPAAVTFRGNQVPIGTDVLLRALRFAPKPPRIAVRLDPEVLDEELLPAFQSRIQPARDAEFRVSGDTVRLIPASTGRRLNTTAIAAAIVARPGTPARARFQALQPEVTTAELRKLNITELVSSFTTPYQCCQPRVTNIKRGAELLDGMIIPPNGRFSLNEALGERTAERGFVEAPQIAGGRLEDAVGGGVSQIATTLYNAAFFAGLEIVTHTPHEFYISRYPPGREATVSFGGPELIFVNDWEAGILIDAYAGDSGITIRFFSSKLGRRVETSSSEPSEYVEPKTITEVDEDLEPGAREVTQEAGGAGFKISYTRKVYRGDDLKREDSFTWRYKPENAYVEVGPEKEEEPEEPEEPTGSTRTEREPEPPPSRTPTQTPTQTRAQQPPPPPATTTRGTQTIKPPSPLPPPLPPPMPAT
jgi:vancomycin resistance protein YoaR